MLFPQMISIVPTQFIEQPIFPTDLKWLSDFHFKN